MGRFALSLLLAACVKGNDVEEASLLSVKVKKHAAADRDANPYMPPNPYAPPNPFAPLPAANCPKPEGAKVCAFWGDPHWSHLFSQDSGKEINEATGGNWEGHPHVAEFMPKGLYKLAESDDGQFEVQTFMCPAYGTTTTSVATAVRTGKNVVSFVRSKATAPKSDDPNDKAFFAVMGGHGIPDEDMVEVFINGKKKKWSDLGGEATRGPQVPDVGGGTPIGRNHYLQQMHTSSGRSMIPACVGDNDLNNLVEVSTLSFDNPEHKAVVAAGLAVRMTNPKEDGGICNEQAADLQGKPQEIADKYRVEAKDSLFTAAQMSSLCSMCRLNTDEHHDTCGGPVRQVSAQEVCDHVGSSYKIARRMCLKEMDKRDPWLDDCIMETCADGRGAVEVAKAEEEIAERYEKQLPKSNCPAPEESEVCHFWGDPHFTHLFSEPPNYGVAPGSEIALHLPSRGRWLALDKKGYLRPSGRDSGVTFSVINAGRGQVALKVGDKFCTDMEEGVVCDCDSVDRWGKFKVVEVSDGLVAIQGARDKKICGVRGGKIVCDEETVTRGCQKFAVDVQKEGEVPRGARMGGHPALVHYQPQGNFRLGASADGHFEVQSFFCEAYGTTSTGIGLAVRIGQSVFQMVRSELTAPTEGQNDKAKDIGYYANFHDNAKRERDFIEYYVNGNRMEWSQIGKSRGTRSKQIRALGGGIGVGRDGWLQQMKASWDDAMLPVCVGDSDIENVVEVAVPWMDTEERQRVFNAAVTLRMKSPAEVGLCGETGDLHKTGEKHRVPTKQSLFSARQMKSMCSMCRLESHNGACGAPEHQTTAKEVCAALGASYGEAKKLCRKDFEANDDWLETCIMETCAEGPMAERLAVVEREEARLEG